MWTWSILGTRLDQCVILKLVESRSAIKIQLPRYTTSMGHKIELLKTWGHKYMLHKMHSKSVKHPSEYIGKGTWYKYGHRGRVMSDGMHDHCCRQP